MRGPYRKRHVHTPPRFGGFKPVGVPRKFLERVVLSLDEYEAIRLADYERLDHLAASQRMNISRPTFTRLIEKARHKLASALVEGKELMIEGGKVDFQHTLHHCRDCGRVFERPFGEEVPDCPACGSARMENLAWRFIGRRRGRW